MKLYGFIRVVRMYHPPAEYDGWLINPRSPRIGDTGNLPEIYPSIHNP
jgi:hypothetical protein